MQHGVVVGVVSPGAMGSAVGHALMAGGARAVATVAGRSERTAALATRAGIECLSSLDDVVREADVVLSIAPPAEAAAIATDVVGAARTLAVRPLFVDLNAIAPATARRLETDLAGQLDVVDGSISGPPPWKPGTTRFYLSGARAHEVEALPFAGVTRIVVGHEVGAASAVKMCTASVYKGTAALLTHALLTARAHGLVQHVLDDLGTSLPNLVDGVEHWIGNSATKAGRYVGEMQEIAATQAEAGLPPALFEAMAEVYGALSERPFARRIPEEITGDLSLEEVLEGLGPPTLCS
jgi:3-hydroxyisobutyrate dehydrogenase-like beta-hydroxyacid dehydrogenase